MDFWNTLHKQFRENGFFQMEGKEPNLFWRAEHPVFYLIYFLDKADPIHTQKEEYFTAYARDMQEQLRDMQCTRLVALSVSVDNSSVDSPVDIVDNIENNTSTENAAVFYRAEDQFFRLYWEFSPELGVTANAGQPDRLLGIEKLLAAAARGELPEKMPLREETDEKPTVTLGIFLICVALLCWTMLSGHRAEIIAAYGLSRDGILAGQYYRFITSMFLHSGILHLASNGVYLFYFGTRAELLLGHARYLLLYFAAGICGGLLSITLNGWLAIGASGAIYGLLGAMLLLTRKRGARVTGMSYSTMLILAISAVALGFMDPQIDNFAHIGGLLGGILVFQLLMQKGNSSTKNCG